MKLNKTLKNLKCLLGLHQYNKNKTRSKLIREYENEYDFYVEDECENCGKVRNKIVVIKE